MGLGGQNMDIGYRGPGVNNAIVRGNYLGGGGVSFNPNNTNVTMTDNFFYAEVPPNLPTQYPSNTYVQARPTEAQVFVHPNAYEAGRANITVYNWDLEGTLSVDVSSVLLSGEEYGIRDAQNYFGSPVAGGIYDGNPITIPYGSLGGGADCRGHLETTYGSRVRGVCPYRKDFEADSDQYADADELARSVVNADPDPHIMKASSPWRRAPPSQRSCRASARMGIR